MLQTRSKLLKFFLIITSVMLSACTSGYQKFYKPFADVNTPSNLQLLPKGETPKIISSNNLTNDIKDALSKGWQAIGESSFNGALESENGIIRQAKAVGASLVLVSSQFTETRTTTTPLVMPNNQTTYTSGAVYGSYGSTNYSGSSTTYGNTIVPITSQRNLYNQHAIYFVKTIARPKFGIFPIDLPPELRTKYERNTGALINIISENSPAFSANLLSGDVILEINGVPVINAKQSMELMDSTNPIDGRCIFKILRNGSEKLIHLQLEKSKYLFLK